MNDTINLLITKASLLRLGVLPSHLAYIKPVTQCEAEQSVTMFCEKHHIACQGSKTLCSAFYILFSLTGIGPVVFYSGFTRSFLNRETESTEELMAQVKNAVTSSNRLNRPLKTA